MNNFLIASSKWINRQDENFLTEAFVCLLQNLLQSDFNAGKDLIFVLLTGNKNTTTIKNIPKSADYIEIKTQINTAYGRPDIVIKLNDLIAFIEVKKESALGHLQLKRYRKELNSCFVSEKRLILLTRYSCTINHIDEKPDIHIKWYDIAFCLEEIRKNSCLNIENKFLIDQFLGYLKYEGIYMEKISWELSPGVKSLRNLINMFGYVIENIDSKLLTQRSAGWDWIGYYVLDKKAWCGIIYDAPSKLVLHTHDVKINIENKPDFGEIRESNYYKPDGKRWYNEIELESEDEHFFARSKPSQIKCIEEFLKKSIEGFEKVVVL